ncbi:Heat shock protein Hsp20 [hydrothermal vent metagenome]|uniref:Heat shock protein Hsp20 n=1 Tax=hydrothermal vent metagenome TaxID=652676 RepID=A0A1W1BBW5_9ZZZZ
MLVTRFDPFREIKELENRIFQNYVPAVQTEKGINAFTPSVNTREDEKAYYIEVDLPGVKKEDIKVDIKDNTLTISGERKLKEEVKEEDYYKIETSIGKFTRTFTLPEDADIENIDAKSENGVLEVVIPKVKKEQSVKTIEVK